MAFEVIPGGLLLAQLAENDIPCPDKPIEEWTEEENEAYHRYLYENAEPGTPEAVIKALDVSTEAIQTVINTLEAIRAGCEAAAAETGYRSEWPHLDAAYLLTLLRLRSEARPVPDQSVNAR